MKPYSILATALVLLAFTLGHAAEKETKVAKPAAPKKKADLSKFHHPPESEARLNKWFRDAKFGAFIHFGAYSPLAGKYKDKIGGNYAEWIQVDAAIPTEEYRTEVAARFNPQEFDAEEWVRMFKDNGMRYVVITSKHHDGFALYDSACCDYDVMDASPFKRDIIKELSEACHKHGLKFGVYYSHAQDWSDPDSTSFFKPQFLKKLFPELPAERKPDVDAYIARKALPQIKELISNYDIDLIWFDTPNGLTPEQARRFHDAVRELNPDCVINSRVVLGSVLLKKFNPDTDLTPEMFEVFDYVSLGDKEIPSAKFPFTTESPDSVSSSYGYKAHGKHTYHSLQELIHRLVHTVCGGGNYLLNCGPMGNGQIDPKAVELYAGLGAWLRDNGASIFDTLPNPLPIRPAWGDASLSKDEKNLYLHVMKWPKDGQLTVEGVIPKVASVTFLSPKASDRKVDFTQDGAALKISLTGQAVDPDDTVVKVFLSEPFNAKSRAEPGTAVQEGIVPKPFLVEAKKDAPFEIGAETGIVPVGVESKAVAEYLRNRIAASTGMSLNVRDTAEANTIVLRIDPDAVKFPEKDAYILESGKDKITITGKSASGLFYGVQTLFQLLPPEIYSDKPVPGMKLSVQALTIQDKPSMEKIRGLHVDIARHFRTKEELKKIIDAMAMHKLNTLHLHPTDDQGWRLEIKSFPKLTTVGAVGNKSDPNAPAAFLTQEEVKELCAYAAERHISIIPEIDMPGHMSAVIRAYPELKHPKETREKTTQAIRGDAVGRDFAKKVLAEVNAMFDPEYLHIGFDEVNYKSPVELYSESELVDFGREITSFIKKDLKKTPIVWDDVFMHGLNDKEIVVQWWRYGKKFWWKHLKQTVDEELNLKGQPYILSPAYWTYFDMPNAGKGWAGGISPADIYNWDPLGDTLGVTPETRQLALGAIACTWSEKIPTMKVFGDHTFPRLTSFSERVWRGGKSEDSSILSWTDYRDTVLIPYQLKRYDAMGVWYWSKDKPDLLKNLADTRKTL